MLHKSFSLKFRWFDAIVIAVCIVVALGLTGGIVYKNKALSGNDRYVNIYQNQVLLEEYKVNLTTLKEKETIILKKENYPTLLADFTIEIDPSKGVRTTNITCNDHTCEKQGWVNITGMPIVCIPNSVYIEIVSSSSSSGGDITIGGVNYGKYLA